MFSAIAGRQPPKSSEVYQWWASRPEGKLLIEFMSSLDKITPSLDDTSIEKIQLPSCGPAENINPTHAPGDRFMDANNEFLLTFVFPEPVDLGDRREIKGLPHSYVSHVLLNRIFPEDWETININNNLTGLDYLSNLEWARCTALRGAAQRLKITEHNWHTVLLDDDKVWTWVRSMRDIERRVELLHSALWVDLRIWIMVRELQSEPFYKPNVIAMLNTLFPPVITALPSIRVSKEAMWNFRSTFYRYLVSIEANGKSELDGFVGSLSGTGSNRAWSNVRRNLQEYVRLADSMIKQAAQIEDVSSRPNAISQPSQVSDATATSELADKPSREASLTAVSDEQEDQPPEAQSYSYLTPPRHKISGRFLHTTYKGRDLNGLNIHNSNIQNFGEDFNNKKFSGQTFHAQTLRQKLSFRNFSAPNDSTQTIRNKRSAQDLWTQNVGAQNFDTDNLSTKGLNDAANQKNGDELWYSSPQGQPSLNTQGHAEISAWSPDTDTHDFELPKYDRRPASATTRRSLSYTPELPRNRPSDDRQSSVQSSEPLLTPRKPKWSFLKLFRKKQKAATSLSPVVLGPTDPIGESKPYVPSDSRDFKGKSREDNMGSRSVEPQVMKTKSSFGFLRGRQIGESRSVVSDNNSDRPITNAETRSGPKLGPKSSFASLFTAKAAHANVFRSDRDGSDKSDMKAGENFDNPHRPLRKACSYGSVKSSSLANRGEKEKNATRSASSAGCRDDRIFTSADISEPFPFGISAQPQTRASFSQTPALLLEKSQEFGYMEEKRQELLEKARRESIGRLGEDPEFRKKLDLAHQKRVEKRSAIDVDAQDSKWNTGILENGESSKENQTPKRGVRVFSRSEGRARDIQTPSKSNSNAAEPRTPGSGKASIGKRLMKEFASAYSPTG